ncbi:phosphate acyltransferase PlsX [Bombilactobacillus thymidiniphilus]|uniref:Phosphate acyltransferase n=1 Tax=Bombilactobacillus thymidiniphilus TaxID=2923363 RepID=A0ABY4PCS3_9LACO|nr:phosphate acyltransferase PlsX [Bombilactobacillus thymidiniphilus]UQS83468.1 phosphate acyltransferase PlsX [Bombilactobacillus thymidiniphilus]
MKVAVDAMGGDNAPQVVVEGVKRARDEFSDLEFILFGDQEQIKQYLDNDERITIMHTTTQILGTDEPMKAIRQKKDSSMVLAAQAVKDGQADAMTSLGNSGALLAAGIFIIGRLKNISRPALMPTMPIIAGDHGFVLLDAGANAEVKVDYLKQWAIMASFYASEVEEITNPRVALLNNGSEFDKGDRLHQEAYQQLSQLEGINFVGNVEADNVLQGSADVIVTDGFTGNAVLKSIEGTAKLVVSELKNALLNNGLKAKLGAALAKPALINIKDTFDVSKYGGAVLMGVKAPVVKSHGSSDARTVYYALVQLRMMYNKRMLDKVIQYFDQEHK